MSNIVKPIIDILSRHGGDFKFDDYLYIHDPLTFNIANEIESCCGILSFDFFKMDLRNGKLSALTNFFLDMSEYRKFIFLVNIEDIEKLQLIKELLYSKFKEDIVIDYIIEDYRNSF